MLFILLSIILVFWVYNNSGLFYKESSDYSKLNYSKYLDGAEPFYSVKKNDKAVLLIHGFPGSPKMYYLFREYLVKSGYDVFSPTLPGFGTKNEDLYSTNFSIWHEYLKKLYKKERKNYKKFYIVGNSMGGALTLKLAEDFSLDSDYSPTAIAAVASPVFLNSIKHRTIKSPLLFIVRTIALFTSYIKPVKPPRSRVIDIDGDSEWVGYRGLFPKQIYSLIRGLKNIEKNLDKITVPCYLAHAKEDKTVPYKNLLVIKKSIKSDDVLLRTMSLKEYDHTNHSMFIYKSVVGKLWSDIEYFFNSLD